MAQMNRNVNLEEINSDALFGIDALKNQTLLQKVVFFGSVLGGVALNVMLPIMYGISSTVCVFLFLGLLVIGVAFGCNYTEDMTYGKYLYYFFFKPSKPLRFDSTEDVESVKKKALELRREEEIMLRNQRNADPEAQRKLLKKMIIFVVIFVIAIVGIFAYGSARDKGNIHHTVEGFEESEVEGERK